MSLRKERAICSSRFFWRNGTVDQARASADQSSSLRPVYGCEGEFYSVGQDTVHGGIGHRPEDKTSNRTVRGSTSVLEQSLAAGLWKPAAKTGTYGASFTAVNLRSLGRFAFTLPYSVNPFWPRRTIEALLASVCLQGFTFVQCVLLDGLRDQHLKPGEVAAFRL